VQGLQEMGMALRVQVSAPTSAREHQMISLEPDPHMRWIYDYTHPEYNSPKARDLRERRRVAMQNAPQWMIREAEMNDSLSDAAGERK
jgi:hypothetical protein